jgi:formaldehyde-activating enzyme involved in methanogenesis
MQKKKPTRKQEREQFAAQLQASNFWGHVQFSAMNACWEKLTNEKLPEGMLQYVLTVVQDVVKVSAATKAPMKLDGTVAAAIERFLQVRPDRIRATDEAETEAAFNESLQRELDAQADHLIVTPAQAREEALAGEPLVVLK